ncbi:hypothetical protein OROMI_004140 [Orobanche minor]
MTIEIGVTMLTFGEIYGDGGIIIKAISLKYMGKESRMNSPDDKGCIYVLGSLGVALSATATSSSQYIDVGSRSAFKSSISREWNNKRFRLPRSGMFLIHLAYFHWTALLEPQSEQEYLQRLCDFVTPFVAVNASEVSKIFQRTTCTRLMAFHTITLKTSPLPRQVSKLLRPKEVESGEEARYTRPSQGNPHLLGILRAG